MAAEPSALLAQLQEATQHAEALKKLNASHLGPTMPWKARQVREGGWVGGWTRCAPNKNHERAFWRARALAQPSITPTPTHLGSLRLR